MNCFFIWLEVDDPETYGYRACQYIKSKFLISEMEKSKAGSGKIFGNIFL